MRAAFNPISTIWLPFQNRTVTASYQNVHDSLFTACSLLPQKVAKMCHLLLRLAGYFLNDELSNLSFLHKYLDLAFEHLT